MFVICDDVMYVECVKCVDSDVVEMEIVIYKMDDVKCYYNEIEGVIVYVFNVDIFSKVEVEKLKILRCVIIIKNIFKYDMEKFFDFKEMILWVIVVFILLFK